MLKTFVSTLRKIDRDETRWRGVGEPPNCDLFLFLVASQQNNDSVVIAGVTSASHGGAPITDHQVIALHYSPLDSICLFLSLHALLKPILLLPTRFCQIKP